MNTLTQFEIDNLPPPPQEWLDEIYKNKINTNFINMTSKNILQSHPMRNLKKEVSKTNIKGYSKMKKEEIINLMMKYQDRFKHIKMYVPESKKKVEPKKEEPKKEEPKKEEPKKEESEPKKIYRKIKGKMVEVKIEKKNLVEKVYKSDPEKIIDMANSMMNDKLGVSFTERIRLTTKIKNFLNKNKTDLDSVPVVKGQPNVSSMYKYWYKRVDDGKISTARTEHIINYLLDKIKEIRQDKKGKDGENFKKVEVKKEVKPKKDEVKKVVKKVVKKDEPNIIKKGEKEWNTNYDGDFKSPLPDGLPASNLKQFRIAWGKEGYSVYQDIQVFDKKKDEWVGKRRTYKLITSY
jgi:hypothetical protein